ncbi:uncharacterized protein [Heterodontus francisci]|uniref:uncharacterized protein n=1 Tax=Heterodontus francisci TaxID=7792 RepID=UPI00355C498D
MAEPQSKYHYTESRKNQAKPRPILLRVPSHQDGNENIELDAEELRKAKERALERRAEVKKRAMRLKERDAMECCGLLCQEDMLQVTQLPILTRKPSINECQNEFRKELKRDKECTPLSTVIVSSTFIPRGGGEHSNCVPEPRRFGEMQRERSWKFGGKSKSDITINREHGETASRPGWSIRKDMPDTLYRWFILQELCKYGPIDSVIFSGHRHAQVVFSDILSACKVVNTHSTGLPEKLYHCFWYYPFMMQNYRF